MTSWGQSLAQFLARGACNEIVYLLREKLHRQSSLPQCGIMEIANVEVAPQSLFGFRTKGTDSELPHLICQSLARHGDVSINFGDRLFGSVSMEIVNRLFARPPELMNPRVHNQSNSAEAFARELSI